MLKLEEDLNLTVVAVNLMDELQARYLYVAADGQIGRKIGIYALIEEKLREIAQQEAERIRRDR